MLFNPPAKSAAWLATLRQILMNSSGIRRDVWFTRSRVTIPWNTGVAACLGAEAPLFWQRAKKHNTAKSGFFLSLFPNVYLLCEFRQVSPWTCKTDFPAGLCIFACIDLHSIKLQYLWLNFAKCCSDTVVWFWSKYSRHTHILPNLGSSGMQNTWI